MSDRRRLALTAPHGRSRERFLAFHDIAQGTCVTHVAARSSRHPQTVMGWLHSYSEHGLAALRHRRTNGCPPFCPDIAAALDTEVTQPSKKQLRRP